MNLFQFGGVVLRGGAISNWKVDCDALTELDLACLANLIVDRVGTFGAVEGVPRGGLRLAKILREYGQSSAGPLLIVDDVCTTGGALEAHRAGREAMGAVIFARGPVPKWVTPIWTLSAISGGQ